MNSGPDNIPDDNTVRRFIAGDRDAFDDLYCSFAPQMLAFLVARMKTLQDAEDVAQFVFAQAWKKRESFNGNHFKGWVFKIARHRLIDHARSSKRHDQAPLDEGHEIVENADSTEIVRREEELTAFGDCVKSVGGKFVEAVVRTHLQGESPEDLAKEEGVARGTIDTRVSRGKQQLRECMEKKKK